MCTSLSPFRSNERGVALEYSRIERRFSLASIVLPYQYNHVRSGRNSTLRDTIHQIALHGYSICSEPSVQSLPFTAPILHSWLSATSSMCFILWWILASSLALFRSSSTRLGNPMLSSSTTVGRVAPALVLLGTLLSRDFFYCNPNWKHTSLVQSCRPS